jgi:hypothetical protein
LPGRAHGEHVQAQVDEEKDQGLADLGFYRSFADKVAGNRQVLVELLCDLRDRGKRLAGYGAPAKGNTLLNYCGIDSNLLPFVVDKNPLKVGRFTPGTHIPVLPVNAIDQREPDYLLILAWNFAEEIMRQQVAFRQRGGRFIVPIPQPVIV